VAPQIVVKTPAEIERMRRGGKVLGRILRDLAGACRPGITTDQLDQLAEQWCREEGGSPSFKGYRGYPKALCVSVNDEVVHGIPGPRELVDGDIVSLDMGVYLDGYHTDSATTVAIGEVTPAARELMRRTEESLQRAVKLVQPGRWLYDVCGAVQNHVEAHGFSVVRDLVGHGLGRKLHEPPEVPNYRPKGKGPRLLEGMTLAIEPMVNQGTSAVRVLEDRWTVVTADRKLSAHYEHTVAVTKRGVEVLTLPPED
jgi:methionyl aminopeptidase